MDSKKEELMGRLNEVVGTMRGKKEIIDEASNVTNDSTVNLVEVMCDMRDLVIVLTKFALENIEDD